MGLVAARSPVVPLRARYAESVTLAPLPLVTCPHGHFVEGVVREMSGCVCGVMAFDQARADPILEGAPVGVFVSVGDDPSTFFNLCAGQGGPVIDPDELPMRRFGEGHYSACPIHLAQLEITRAERVFAAPERPEPAEPGPGASLGPLPVTDADMRG